MNFKKIFSILMTLAVCSFAQINLLSNGINFRDAATAVNTTYHYGDLRLTGGNAGTSWGWLYSNAAFIEGDLNVNGWTYTGNSVNIWGSLYVSGTKNFIQPHPTDSTKVIKYVAIESGEALTIARGTANTSYGIARIALPEHYSLVTSDEAPLTVLLTPKKAPAVLYTKEEDKSQIVVAMKESDLREFGDVEFSWQVTGVRDGFENQEVIVDADQLGKEDASGTISPKRSKMNERVAQMKEKQKDKNRSKSK